MEIRRPVSDRNTQAATGLRTRPTFRDVVMEALRMKYVGVVMNPLVRKLLHEELERIVPHVIDQIASAVSQQMRVELERMMVPHFIHQTTRLVHQQLQGELQNVVSQIITQTQHVVGQQMDRLIAHTSQSLRYPTPHVEEATQVPYLQLVFVEKLLQQIYAGDVIKDKNNKSIQVCLKQVEHGESSIFSPESRIQLEIVVLDGTFPQENIADWNADEFNRHVLDERENKRRLLAGNRKVTLDGEKASFDGLRITDNSSWVKSRKFRLGVRVSPASCGGQRIKEAISECFVVLDQRGKSNQKAYPPSLDDKVWRLENIARNGPISGRLANAGIETVQDLLKLSVVNLQRLRDIVKMPAKHALNETIRHARTCDMGDDHYIFKTHCCTLILNPICEVVIVQNVDGSTRSFDQDSSQLKEILELAYKNWNNLEKIHPQTNTIISQERKIDSVRVRELEPHNWYCDNLHTVTYDPHRGPFVDGGEPAGVLGQLPQPLQMGNAPKSVLMEPLESNNWSGMTCTNFGRPHNLPQDAMSIPENSIFADIGSSGNILDHQLPPHQGNADEPWDFPSDWNTGKFY